MTRDMMFSGSFYPGTIEGIEDFINKNYTGEERIKGLKGVVVPHAGWIYSGEIALSGYSRRPYIDPETLVIVGPSHRVPFKGVAITNYEYYSTPFGNLEVDRDLYNSIIDITGVRIIDDAHMYEHSLEVQLPFLKKIYPNCKIAPIVAGSSSTKILKKIFKSLSKTSFIICSTDLSHYLKYDEAVTIDSTTIENLINGKSVDSDAACGSVILNSLVEIERQGDLRLKLVKYCNSGDTAGDKERVVGYCSMEILDV